jgi:shikimate kinase
MSDKSNIVLIGMCGVGKSTVGIILAKLVGYDFVDTDVVIQARERKTLQYIIDEEGTGDFADIEERHILQLDVWRTVIATGGSAVYSKYAMKHLAENAVIVHLDLDIETIEKRVTDIYTRGVVMEDNENLRSLYAKRQPLYEKYAQFRIDCGDKTQQQIAEEITRLAL